MRDPELTADNELLRTVVALVRRRTGGRVRELVVTKADGRLVIRGTADSYYAWQLMLAGASEALAKRADLLLDCQLRVVARREPAGAVSGCATL